MSPSNRTPSNRTLRRGSLLPGLTVGAAIGFFGALVACNEIAGVDFGSATLATPIDPQSAASCTQTCTDLGFECGRQFDPCGKELDCGACKDGTSCENGKCGCTAKACSDLGVECGTHPNGCGGVADCGKCPNPNDACVDGKCKCQPKTCPDQGAECGNVPDNCGGQYACGTCGDAGAPNCGGAGPNKCGANPCQPTSCAAQGKDCGTMSDGCGTILTCGAGCTAPQTCGGGGVANKCGCTPTTCAAQGKNCGQIPDGCGGMLDCGACAAPNSCAGAGTANVCGCTSNGSCNECCAADNGPGQDNCGRACIRNTCCGSGCFGAGSPVRLADGSTKPIERIVPGDVVASYDVNGHRMLAARVLGVLVHGAESSAAGFVVTGGARITPNHPIYIDGRSQHAGALKVGSKIYAPGRERLTQASLDPIVIDQSIRSMTIEDVALAPGNGESTYDLEVEGTGTFFVGPLLAQRKIPR